MLLQCLLVLGVVMIHAYLPKVSGVELNSSIFKISGKWEWYLSLSDEIEPSILLTLACEIPLSNAISTSDSFLHKSSLIL